MKSIVRQHIVNKNPKEIRNFFKKGYSRLKKIQKFHYNQVLPTDVKRLIHTSAVSAKDIKLRFSGLEDSSLLSSLLAFIRKTPFLKSFFIQFVQELSQDSFLSFTFENFIPVLKKKYRLTDIHLGFQGFPNIIDSILKSVQKIYKHKNLRSLKLDFTECASLSDLGVKTLVSGVSQCLPDSLEVFHLNLNSCDRVTVSCIERILEKLKTLPKLRDIALSLFEIDYPFPVLHKDTYRDLSPLLSNLAFIFIADNDCTAFLDAVSKLKNLKRFKTIVDDQVHNMQSLTRALVDKPHIRKLNLNLFNRGTPTEGLYQGFFLIFASMKQLYSLKLQTHHRALTQEGLTDNPLITLFKSIRTCTNMKKLDLELDRFSLAEGIFLNEAANSVKDFKRLEKFRLNSGSFACFTAENCERFGELVENMPHLRKLRLNMSEISNMKETTLLKINDVISKLKNLKYLVLRFPVKITGPLLKRSEKMLESLQKMLQSLKTVVNVNFDFTGSYEHDISIATFKDWLGKNGITHSLNFNNIKEKKKEVALCQTDFGWLVKQ